MHTIFIITEVEAKKNLEQALQGLEDSYEILVLRDYLNIGSLFREETSFSNLRTELFNQDELINEPIADLENLMAVSTRLTNGEDAEVCFWMAKNPQDVCTFYWLIHYLKKHYQRLNFINIADLPFLNEENQLFYPALISQLPAKEFNKSLKLKRPLSSSEFELYGEEWSNLVTENADLRIIKEGKQLQGVAADYYDNTITNAVRADSRRLSTVLRHLVTDLKYQIQEPFLKSRITYLENAGVLGTQTQETVDEEEPQQ